jgi:TetR/AcrR family transcriptional regulator, transcriptional repressor for nem operon
VARTKEFNSAAALRAAMDVFWDNGYANTTLDDLMAGTKVGRQSLYDTFGDKRSLYLQALNEYRTSTQAAMRALFASELTIQECFRTMLFGICEETRAQHERGCLLLSANLERNTQDKDVAAIVRRNQSEVGAIFENAFRDAQGSGQLAREKDPAALASFMLAALQGMRQAARAVSDRTSLELTARVALSTLD